MSFSADVQQFIASAAGRFGISENYLRTTAMLESSGNINATYGSAQGLFQFKPGTAAEFGLSNPFDPQQSTDAAAQYAKSNLSFLQSRLGRAPTDAELYLAHQQGPGGALALLTHGSENAGLTVGNMAAITGNGGTANMTSSDFVSMITGKFAAAGGDAGANSGGSGAVWSPDKSPGMVENFFVRAVVVLTGMLVFYVGLTMFRNQSDRTVLGARKPLRVDTTHSGEVTMLNSGPDTLPEVEPVKVAREPKLSSSKDVFSFAGLVGRGSVPKSIAESPKATRLTRAAKERKFDTGLVPKFDDSKSEIANDFEARKISRPDFAHFVAGKFAETDEAMMALTMQFFPSSKVSQTIRQRVAAKKQNESAELTSLVDKNAPIKPVVSKEELAELLKEPSAAQLRAKSKDTKPSISDDKVKELLKAPSNEPAKAVKVEEAKGIKVGDLVQLEDKSGKGRTDEPFVVQELWQDPKHGVGAKIKPVTVGSPTGEGFFTLDDLKKLEKGIMRPIKKRPSAASTLINRALKMIKKEE